MYFDIQIELNISPNTFLYNTVILALMRGEQSKDCQKSAQSLPVVELSAK